MTRTLRIVRPLLVSSFLVAIFAPVSLAQQSSGTNSNQGWRVFHEGGTISNDSSAPPVFNNGPADPNQAHMLHAMAKQREALRQKQIVEDTNHLLDLAKQLKDAVDKSSRDQLSLNVVNTAAEIEKLAKSVKQKMRDGE
jgi:hypothetical protein